MEISRILPRTLDGNYLNLTGFKDKDSSVCLMKSAGLMMEFGVHGLGNVRKNSAGLSTGISNDRYSYINPFYFMHFLKLSPLSINYTQHFD